MRESLNVVEIIGKIAELEVGTGLSKEKIPYIKLDMTVRIKENYEIPVKFFAQRYNSKKEPSKLYDFLEDLAKNIKTIAKYGIEEADIISIDKGKLVANIYKHPKTNEIIKKIEVNASFCNITNSIEGKDFKAEFMIEGVVDKVKTIFNKENGEIECAKVALIVSNYNGTVEILEFDCKDKLGIDFITTEYKNNPTVQINGEIINKVDIKEIITPSGFGRNYVTTEKNYVRSFSILGGTPPLPELKQFNIEEIKQALKEMNIRHENILNKTSVSNNTFVENNQYGSPSISDMDIPF